MCKKIPPEGGGKKLENSIYQYMIIMEMPVIPKQLRTEYAESDKEGRIAGDFFI